MNCPQCNNELIEGATICPKCNVNLADALPQSAEIQDSQAKTPLRIRKTFTAKLAKWLIVGGVIYIILGSLDDIMNFISQIISAKNQNQPFTIELISLYALNICYNLLDTALWGLFFIGLGKIIQILKVGFHYEN